MKNGRKLEMQLVFSAKAFVPDAIALPMIEEARAVGIDLVIRQYDRRVLWALDGPLYRGRFQTALLTLTNGLDPDPSAFLSCDQQPPNGYNFARYCDVAVDRALRYAASVYDRAERRRIYGFVQRRLIADVPYDSCGSLARSMSSLRPSAATSFCRAAVRTAPSQIGGCGSKPANNRHAGAAVRGLR